LLVHEHAVVASKVFDEHGRVVGEGAHAAATQRIVDDDVRGGLRPMTY
jgi:hypothetical protein